jgi:hypothetical protein
LDSEERAKAFTAAQCAMTHRVKEDGFSQIGLGQQTLNGAIDRFGRFFQGSL